MQKLSFSDNQYWSNFIFYATIKVSMNWPLLLSYKGLSWSWSYGSWINNCLCNPCILPLTLSLRIPLMARCGNSVVFSGYSGFPTNKTDWHDITEILLKVALNTIILTLGSYKLAYQFTYKNVSNLYTSTDVTGIIAVVSHHLIEN